MKILFLDIDGVLNSEKYYRSVDRTKKNWSRFDPTAVLLVKKLVEEFSLEIVITSTWRFGAIKMLNDELNKSELLKYLHQDWKTPQTDPSHRGKEIKLWLDRHPEIIKYIVIDDSEEVVSEKLEGVVKTDQINGMMLEHYAKAKEYLII